MLYTGDTTCGVARRIEVARESQRSGTEGTQHMAQMQVFVSHSHQNNDFCAGLVKALGEAGADVWYDDQSLHAGRLGPTVERELRQRPVFIVVLSPAALASRWVYDEAYWAYGRLKRDPSRIILPVLAEALADADDIWLFLQDFKRIEAPGTKPYPLPEAIARTLHALALTAPGEAPVAPTPQPSESVDELLAQGKALMAQKKYAEAIPFLERATQRDPRSFAAWANLGWAYNSTGRYSDGLAANEKALALDDTQAWVWDNKAAALGNLRRYEEALAAYDRALELDPKFALTWTGKGAALAGLRRFEEALAAHDRALALDPKVALCWRNQGSTLCDLNRGAEGLAAYERSLLLDPQSARGWNGKARALRLLGREAEAQEAERRAQSLGG